MAGHSKWATTKHKKAAIDAKRGKIFAKMVKNIEVAARMGGADPEGNPTLYDAIQKAKKASVPSDNIDRAVKRGAGLDGGGVEYMATMYEGYAAGGVAILIECLTDNKNRAAMEVRTAMTRNGGTMADPGSVTYLFARKGIIIVPAAQERGTITEDDVMLAVLEAGAEEVISYDDVFEVTCQPSDVVDVRSALQAAELDYDSADVAFIPSVTVETDDASGEKIMNLVDALEDCDDVQNVYTNAA